MSAMGDVAMSAPVIASVVKAYPTSNFTILTREQFSPIFEPIPRLKVLGLPIDSTYKKPYQFPSLIKLLDIDIYDVVIDLHNVLRSKAITAVAQLKKIETYTIKKDRVGRKEIISKSRSLNKPLSNMIDNYRETFLAAGFPCDKIELDSELYSLSNHQILSKNQNTISIAIAPFARYKEKSLPTDQILKLINLLNQHNLTPYIMGGGKTEYQNAENIVTKVKAVNLVNQYNLRQELSFIKQMDLMITMDSANMHMARLVGTSTISIWGATHPAFGFGGWGMTMDDYFQIQDEALPCRPCSTFGNVPCERKDLACLNQLDINLLVIKVLNRLKTIKNE